MVKLFTGRRPCFLSLWFERVFHVKCVCLSVFSIFFLVIFLKTLAKHRTLGYVLALLSLDCKALKESGILFLVAAWKSKCSFTSDTHLINPKDMLLSFVTFLHNYFLFTWDVSKRWKLQKIILCNRVAKSMLCDPTQIEDTWISNNILGQLSRTEADRIKLWLRHSTISKRLGSPPRQLSITSCAELGSAICKAGNKTRHQLDLLGSGCLGDSRRLYCDSRRLWSNSAWIWVFGWSVLTLPWHP
jgi:hypothetical protein